MKFGRTDLGVILSWTIAAGLILGAGYWLISNYVSDRREESDKQLQIEGAVEYMVLKHGAIADWEQQFEKEDVFENPIYTVELEDALAVTGTRPIMFFSAVQDIVRKADSYSVSLSHWVDLARGLSIYYVLDCTQAQVDEIKRNPNRSLGSNYAVIARISTVKKVRFKFDSSAADGEDYDRPEDVFIELDLFPPDLFIANGVCLDLLYIGDYKFWKY